jgi:hypothetical protein
MARSINPSVVKGAISVTEMAAMLGLSRGHLHALIRQGVFPCPLYCITTRRPFFVAEQQQQCLQIRATNIGANGRFVLFYGPRSDDGSQPHTRRSRRNGTPPATPQTVLVEGLKALGLTAVSEQQVASALSACYPGGVGGVEQGEILRTLWRHIRSSNAA